MLICIAAFAVWAVAILWVVLFGHHNAFTTQGCDKTSDPASECGTHPGASLRDMLEGASGKQAMLCTEDILKGFDNTNLPPELIEGIKQEFREQFGARVPAGVVSRLIAEYEAQFGPIEMKSAPDDAGTVE